MSTASALSPEQAKEKTKIILFDTDLINFTDDGFVCGEADITEQSEDGLDGAARIHYRKIRIVRTVRTSAPCAVSVCMRRTAKNEIGRASCRERV